MIGNAPLDAALSYIRSNASRLDLCDRIATTYADATGSASLGSAMVVNVSAPESHETGRQVAIATGHGKVVRRGKPVMWVVTGNREVLAAGPIESDSPEIMPGVDFDLPPVLAALVR